MSGSGAFERLRELLQLAVPPDEAGQTACGARLKAGASRDDAGQFVDRCGRLEPLHGHGAERLHLDMSFGQPQGVAGDQDGPGLGHLLHPGGKVGGLADRGVVHVQVVANGADDDLAGIEPHANLHGRSARALNLVRIEIHAPLHPQGG